MSKEKEFSKIAAILTGAITVNEDNSAPSSDAIKKHVSLYFSVWKEIEAQAADPTMRTLIDATKNL
ncbi:hypothetical protein HLH33_02995 [Gluconacetobacter diazotrophicus]|uniref:Uncharacterized protein n=1 Tax=Gluconacetobacter diazotrophicus TaxID=33996 RepID=A0A7W4I3U2_GLUDI|nr:hypothetical protein [Gluconacetobacter diazotrophicus]MBB2155284.1 hypothetical protein [Gluconacetobacter diazotrophicus]